MATFYASTSNAHWGLRATTYELSINPAANTSVVRTDIYVGRFNVSGGSASAASASYQSGANYSLRRGLNIPSNQWGTYIYNSYRTFPSGSWILYGTHDVTVTHNADGTGSFTGTYCIQSLNDVKPQSGSVTVSIPLTTFPRTPGSPTNVSVKGATNNSNNIIPKESIRVTWTAGSNATSYKTQYRVYTPSSGWGSWGNETTVSTTSSTRNFPKDLVGNTLQFRVCSVNSSGSSNWVTSNEVFVAGSMSINVNGSWKRVRPFIKQDGVWKSCGIFIKQNNAWKSSK